VAVPVALGAVDGVASQKMLYLDSH
jgi:hypothetical protein